MMLRPYRLWRSRPQLIAAGSRLGPKQSFLVASPLRHSSAAATAPHSNQKSRWPRHLIYAALFGSLGLFSGGLTERHLSIPPTPGSEEDVNALRLLSKAYEGLSIVQDLRNDPDYVEYEAYEDFSEEDKRHRLTSGPMSGSRGLGLQKVFWNDKRKAAISVIHFGSGLEGWPSMVHGGALGTVIDEHLGRAAIRRFPAATGVTANLNINYRCPVYSFNFYTLHTKLDTKRSTDRKAYVQTELRDVTGRVCVEATGIFVVPKQLRLRQIGENF